MAKHEREREREKGWGRDILNDGQTDRSNEPLAIPILSSDPPLSVVVTMILMTLMSLGGARCLATPRMNTCINLANWRGKC